MTNQQRNRLLAQELRALAEMVEYDDCRIIARVIVKPTDEQFEDAMAKYMPVPMKRPSSGTSCFEMRSLDGCFKVRLKGGAA